MASWEVFAMYERQTDVIKLPSSLAVLVLSFAIIVGELVLLRSCKLLLDSIKLPFNLQGSVKTTTGISWAADSYS